MASAITVSIRAANADDIAFLAHAHRAGHSAIEGERGGRLDIVLRGRGEPIEESFAETQADPDAHVCIGEVDGTAVGYLVAVVETMRSAERLTRVSDLWVHPEARGVGVGAALMSYAVDIARSHSCVGIDARALPGDRVTKNFFESFGLVARTIEVHKSLES